MPNNTIELIIKATDAASEQIRGIAEQLGVVEKAADAAKEAFGALAVGFTLDRLVDSITEAQTATNDLNRAYYTFGATVGVSRGEMDEFAESVSKATTLSSGSLKEAQAVLLQYSATAGKSFEDSRQLVVDLSAKMGIDAAQAANLLGRALQNPVTGMRLLAEVGVTLTQQQRALIESFVQTGQSAQAATSVFSLLQERVKGAADALANTLGGALTNLKNSFTSAFEGQGADVQGLTDSIHALALQVQDPKFQQGVQTIAAGVVFMAEEAAKGALAFADFGKAIGEGLARSVTGADSQIGVLEDKVKDLNTLIAQPDLDSDALKGYVDQLKKVEAQLKAVKGAADAWNDAQLTPITTTAKKVGTGPTQIPANPLEFGVQIDPSKAATIDEGRQVYANPFLSGDLVQSYLQDTESDLDKAYDTLSQHINERAQLVAAGQLDATKAFYQNLDDKQTYQDAVDKQFAPVIANAEKLKDPLTDIEKFGDQVASTLQNSFENFFESGDLSFSNLAKTAIKAFEDILAKAVSIDLVNALGLNKLFGAASDAAGGNGSITGGLFGAITAAVSGSSSGTGMTASTLFGGGATASLLGFAGGGQISGNSPIMVGENGPELFLPGTSGTIVNAREAMYQGGASGSGSGVNFAPVNNISITADDSSKTAASLMQYITYSQAQQKADLLRTLGRNGYKIR